MDSASEPRRRPRPKWGTLALVVLLHVAALIALARAFAPDFTAAVVERATSLVTVTVATREEPTAEPSPVPDAGAAAPEGEKAKPRDAADPSRVPITPPSDAPQVASTGEENRSGASEAGAGTGGGGEGTGTGSGASGDGQGNGRRALEKIAGEINSARDYPKKSRDLRIGHSVTILLTVGTDGRVRDCRVTDPSPDPEADRITCELAKERFRFTPATDRRGNPIEGKYAWKQRWFT